MFLRTMLVNGMSGGKVLMTGTAILAGATGGPGTMMDGPHGHGAPGMTDGMDGIRMTGALLLHGRALRPALPVEDLMMNN